MMHALICRYWLQLSDVMHAFFVSLTTRNNDRLPMQHKAMIFVLFWKMNAQDSGNRYFMFWSILPYVFHAFLTLLRVMCRGIMPLTPF